MSTQSEVHTIYLVAQPPNACEMQMKKIVAVIPTLLTREALLLRTIDSVLTQTRGADHIVISCDADERKVRGFAALCKARFAGASIEIATNHGHKGISGNINNALSKLIGFDGCNTLVSLLDDDDYWKPDYLFHVEKKMQEGATFVASASADTNKRREAPMLPPQEIQPDLFLVGNPGISNSTMSIRLDVLRQIGGWNTRLASCTDRDACLRLLEVKAKYVAANEAVAYIDRSHGNARLTDKGSWAKFSGLKEFYRAWRPKMAPQVYADSRARALKLFGYDPGMPTFRPPPEGADLPHLVVAVMALDEALLNRLLLSFENSAAQKFQITFIVFRNNPSLAWNSHAGTMSEVLFFQHPSTDKILKIAEARNFLQMKVRDYVRRHGKKAIIWFLDEDFSVDSTALAKSAEIPSLDLGHADAILGKYEGDSPNAAFSGLLYELSDLYENLLWMQAQPDDSPLPDRSAQNDRLQAAHPETYNYALSHNAKPTPNEIAWLEPAFKGETVAAAKARLLNCLGFIQQGASLFRPLRARTASKKLELGGETLHRGGNTIILNHRMLDVPFPEILYENGSIRRSDMMWAILATHRGGFKIFGSNLYAKHQRCEAVQKELAIEKTRDELIGSIVFNALNIYFTPANQHSFAVGLKRRVAASITMLEGYFMALDDALRRLENLGIAEVSAMTGEIRQILTSRYQETLLSQIENLAQPETAANIKAQFDQFSKQCPSRTDGCDVVVGQAKFKFTAHFEDNIYLLTYGDLSGAKRPLIRLHSSCLFSEVFGATDCDCASQLRAAQDKIISYGCGAILYLDQEGRGHGLAEKTRIVRQMQASGLDTYQACSALGLDDDVRNYANVKKFLLDMGIQKFRLLTNNPAKMAIFTAPDFAVDMAPLRGILTRENKTYLMSKEHKCHRGLLLSKAELDGVWHDASTPIQFESTHGPYGELSNFAKYAVFEGGVIWPTAEHHYQASKFDIEAIREEIRRAGTPQQAKEIAHSSADCMDPNWADNCLTAMYSTVVLKTRQHPEIGGLLIGTKNAEIVEISKEDTVWGRTAEGRGANFLGKILMLIRSEITQDSTRCAG